MMQSKSDRCSVSCFRRYSSCSPSASILSTSALTFPFSENGVDPVWGRGRLRRRLGVGAGSFVLDQAGIVQRRMESVVVAAPPCLTDIPCSRIIATILIRTREKTSFVHTSSQTRPQALRPDLGRPPNRGAKACSTQNPSQCSSLSGRFVRPKSRQNSPAPVEWIPFGAQVDCAVALGSGTDIPCSRIIPTVSA